MGQISTYQELIAAIDRDGVAATVRAHRKPPLHTRILRELYELYPDRPEYIIFLAEYPLIPSDLADTIASAIPPEQVEVAQGLAANPRSSQITLNRLCAHPSPSVRRALAANPNLTPKECQKLVEDENPFVRATVASNPKLPDPLQFLLSADHDSAVRISLAGRRNLDLDVALHLSHDSDHSVRAAVIHNWTADPELLHYWAESNDACSQELLLSRPERPETQLLEILALAPDGKIRRDAAKTCGLPPRQMLALAESDSPLDRVFLAAEPNIPKAIQRILAQDSSIKVRRRLAANPEIDPGIALHIAASEEVPACKALAQNPSILQGCITQLCLHPDDAVALIVAYRDDLSTEHLDLLFNTRTNSTVAEHLAYRDIGPTIIKDQCAEALAKSPAPSHRSFAAQNAHLSTASLDNLSKDLYTPTRLSVARNPNTPPPTLKALTLDHEREVLLAAEDQLASALAAQPRKHQAQEFETTSTEANRRQPLLKKISDFFKD
jgi:hypothetical protein